MKKYGVNDLRRMFLEFFESKEHLRANSFSLVPQNDKSLLLINSGMAPLKAYFTGQEIPPRKRMTTCQKCIRTGDIDNVGKTSRHGTFFEMLGNFSFGDYFKKEAIAWAWEFFTKVLEIPADKLYVSVYEEDDEAADIWRLQEHVPAERIIRMGKADNFWEHGLGPCGPCSEIYFDRGEKYYQGDDFEAGAEADRYVEIWNLVFTQFEKMESGEYVPLQFPNIDTGMGLERLACIMQDELSIFDVDTVKAIRDEVCRLAKATYKEDEQKDISIRVITDHIRSVTFMTSDGILPSNEGRGYVLRRLLRRAARHGRLLGISGSFLSGLAEKVIATSHQGYPELKEKEAHILKVIAMEEERFAETIDQGLGILQDYLAETKAEGKDTLDGAKAFKLYDTYGFPLDLTIEISAESGIKVDEEAFKAEMQEQRERARAAREETNYMGAKETVYNKLPIEVANCFIGYTNLQAAEEIVEITCGEEIVDRAETGETITLFVKNTPFYATSGGQLADKGLAKTETGVMEIVDVKKVVGNNIAHIGKVVSGYIQKGQLADLTVDSENRFATAKNHSATHLLQRALKNVLGEHIEQAGSSVSAERLRFDFTHFQPVTKEELELVEKEVNRKIAEGLEIVIKEMPIDEAKKMGAMALFGEKYGDVVRVIDMGGYSIELCGGTHLTNTSQVGLFKIVSEASVAAGVRRIEALTSEGAFEYLKAEETKLKEIAALVKSDTHQVGTRIEQLLEEIKELRLKNEQLSAKLSGGAAEELLSKKEEIGNFEVLLAETPDMDANALRELGDNLRSKLKGGIVVLASSKDGKVALITMAGDEAIKAGIHSGNIIKAIAPIVGGGGGGKPQMAQAGGKDAEKIGEALVHAKEVIQKQLA
ncbi:alanine--tRNA ligase [Clostridiales bacterium COT073_COT-073]|nr:alanine--tRNA ligase [Clostridiales bacterium COT073_COT-073]